MKAGKKILDSRIEDFCRASSELLQNIHLRCGSMEGTPGKGQHKKRRKKRAKSK